MKNKIFGKGAAILLTVLMAGTTLSGTAFAEETQLGAQNENAAIETQSDAQTENTAIETLSETEGAFRYSLEKGAACIEKYIGLGGDVVIPDTLGGYPVKYIDDKAFKNSENLTGITIPDSVLSIGNEAFADTGLTSLELPAKLEYIGYDILDENTGVKSLTIPASVTEVNSLGTSNFMLKGSRVETVTLERGIRTIVDNMFRDGEFLTSVTIPDTVTSIGNNAFDSCYNLTALDIPDSVLSIGNEAFADTGLTSLELPAKLEYIGYDILDGNTGVKSLSIPASVTEVDSLGISNFMLKGSRVETVTLERGIRTIVDNMFRDGEFLTSVTIPDTVTSIGNNAFDSCYNLTALDIPDSVLSIGDEAFADTGLTSLELPAKLEYIGYDILDGNREVKSLTIPKTVTKVNSLLGFHSMLKGSHVDTVTIQKGLTTIVENMFRNGEYLTSVTIPISVTSIESNAFTNCGSLVIYGFEGSYAQKYANSEGIRFQSIGVAQPKKISLSKTSFAYTGKAIKPTLKVLDECGNVIDSSYYSIVYTNNKNVGTAKVTVNFKGKYSGTLSKSFKITKAANPIKLKTSIKKFKYKTLKKKKLTYTVAYKTKGKGKVTYKLSSTAKKAKIKVSSKGKITVPKGCKKGTYTITIKAAGTSSYKAASRTLYLTIG